MDNFFMVRPSILDSFQKERERAYLFSKRSIGFDLLGNSQSTCSSNHAYGISFIDCAFATPFPLYAVRTFWINFRHRPWLSTQKV
jgi:hypothetical protein